MSKLFARAKIKKFNAENDYLHLSEDDAYLDDLCYNLQQCIELCLKYIVELNGENYIENHDVRAQLNNLRDIGVDLPFAAQIRHLAVTLNSWEAETRYNDDFTAVIEDVEEIRVLADDSRTTAGNIQDISSKVVSAVDELRESANSLLELLQDTMLPDYNEFMDVADSYSQDADKIQKLMNDFKENIDIMQANVEQLASNTDKIAGVVVDCDNGITDASENTQTLAADLEMVTAETEKVTRAAHELHEMVAKYGTH